MRCFEASGTFPTAWHELIQLQVHLPKPNACRPGDGALPVNKLRPISLFSAFWRTYMSARMKSEETQSWIDNQLYRSQAGARRGRDAGATFAVLASAYAHMTCYYFILQGPFFLKFRDTLKSKLQAAS